MYGQRRVNDAVHLYMNELSSRVVAKSGRPSDRFHLGKLILQGLKDEPELILQIDGGTGESETSGSVLERSVRCATALTNFGLKHGDVIVLMAPNHLDLCIPFYAALYLGIAIAPIDRTLGITELEHMFKIDDPKIVFCQSEKANDVRAALKNCNIEAMVITFDEEVDRPEEMSFKKFMMEYGHDTEVENFQATNFDPEETISLLVSTSGTTGLPKQATCTHKNRVIAAPYMWVAHFKFPHPTRACLIVSPLQWGTAILQFLLTPLLRYTRVQTSKDIDQDHFYHLVNTYKPEMIIISPAILPTILMHCEGKCDWSCFEFIAVAGGTVSNKLIRAIKESAPNAYAVNCYGISEVSGPGLIWGHTQAPGSSGNPAGHLQYRLIDVNTKKDILEPNVPGELWVQGPTIVKGYYNNPEATKEAFSEDGWFKTGDMFYRDEHYNFFFVERIKMLLKYKNHQVSPAEIQNVIRSHPGVLDVVVLGIPDYECGDLPVACVVRSAGHSVSAQEIKDLVKENLTDTKQLRGGVIFVEELPLTPSGKVDFKKLKNIVTEFEKK